MKHGQKIGCFNDKTEVLQSKVSIEFISKNYASKNEKTITDATTTILTECYLDKLVE